jgi:catechol-2,3-dioxygenase
VRIRPHIHLDVEDLGAAVAFYEKLFSVAATKKKDDYASFRLHVPPLNLALSQAPAGAARTANQHFGVELYEDTALEGWKEKVRGNGIELSLEEEDTVCCYARARKFWVTDPDGNPWEFWVRREDTEEKGESPELSDANADCCTPAEKAGGCC